MDICRKRHPKKLGPTFNFFSANFHFFLPINKKVKSKVRNTNLTFSKRQSCATGYFYVLWGILGISRNIWGIQEYIRSNDLKKYLV